MNEIDSISAPPLEPPTVAEELAQRLTQTQILAGLFRAAPLKEFSSEELTHVVGPNYRSRIAQLRVAPYEMRIDLVPHWLERADGSKQKLSGGYRFVPYEKLGRDSTVTDVTSRVTAVTKQPSLFG